MQVEPVDAYADLVFHGLAHVPLGGVGSLYDRRYVEWSRTALPVEAREPLATDGPSIATQIDRLAGGLAIQWLPRLHTSLAAFDRTSARDLAELTEADECDAAALRSLRALDPRAVEWLRADLLLASRSFGTSLEIIARERRGACAAIAAALAPVDARSRPHVVRVAWALGARGRGFDDGVVVGACAAWNGLGAATPACLALHEHAVVRAAGTSAQCEWRALCSVARLLAEGHDTLREAHARWLASLDLTSLVHQASAEGRVDRATANELEASPDRRATLFARVSL